MLNDNKIAVIREIYYPQINPNGYVYVMSRIIVFNIMFVDLNCSLFNLVYVGQIYFILYRFHSLNALNTCAQALTCEGCLYINISCVCVCLYT